MIRKYLTKKAILGGIQCTNEKRIGWNTYQYKDSRGNTKIRYTHTDIITITPNEETILNSGGWQSATTKKKINEHLQSTLKNKTIFQEKGIWYLGTRGAKDNIPFFDGIQLNINGEVKAKKAEIRGTIADNLYSKLDSHFDGIDSYYVTELCKETFEAKEQINKILGLNEGNQFRQEFLVNITEDNFNEIYPTTKDFFNAIAEGKNYNPLDNYIEIDNKQKMRFSRYLSRNKDKINSLKDQFSSRVCNELNIRSLDEISIFRDKLKPKKCVISTNPIDFITATEGGSFTSCFRFDGEYFNSTIALCRSNQAVLVYLYDNDRTRKIGRSWAYLFPEEKKFLMLKAYGSFYEAERKASREFIEEKMSKHFLIENLWKKQVIDSYTNHIGHSAPIYLDSYNVTFVRHINADKELVKIELPEAICLFCGSETTHEKGGACESCFEDTYTCDDCGCSMTDDEYYSDDNYYYCNHCYYERYFHCESCGDNHPIDEEHYVDGLGSYCNDCYSDKFHKCEDCGEELEKSRDNYYISEIDDEAYCENCYYERYIRCENCDSETEREDAKKHDGDCYCQTCYEEKFICCEDCKTVIERDEAKELGKNSYCEDCHETELYNQIEELIPDFFNETFLLPAQAESLKPKTPLINFKNIQEQQEQFTQIYTQERVLQTA